jgi:hypothetical protein
MGRHRSVLLKNTSIAFFHTSQTDIKVFVKIYTLAHNCPKVHFKKIQAQKSIYSHDSFEFAA